MGRITIFIFGLLVLGGAIYFSGVLSPQGRVSDDSNPKLLRPSEVPSPRVDRAMPLTSAPKEESAFDRNGEARSDEAELSAASGSEEESGSTSSPNAPISDGDRARLAEMVKYAELFAETYEPSSHTPPEVPRELEEKLKALSPELLALVKIAARIPPRAVRVPTPKP